MNSTEPIFLVIIEYEFETKADDNHFRCAFPKNIPFSVETVVQTHVPCICTHILPPLPSRRPSWARTASEHQLQTLCAVYRGAQASQREGLLGAAGRPG